MATHPHFYSMNHRHLLWQQTPTVFLQLIDQTLLFLFTIVIVSKCQNNLYLYSNY